MVNSFDIRFVGRCGLALAVGLVASTAGAASLQVIEQRVTLSPGIETTPTMGADAGGAFVVYTSYEIGPTGYGSGMVMYQPLMDGAAYGAPVLISTGKTDDRLNDVSGDFIVYSAYDSTTTSSGTVMLYEVSSTARYPIASSSAIGEVRIGGNHVAWVEGPRGNTQVRLLDIALVDSGSDGTVLAGPASAADHVQLSDRLVVWDELSGTTRDVHGYDLASNEYFTIAADPALTESYPATSGPWVVWEAASGDGSISIQAYDVDTGEYRTIIDDGAVNRAPSISGNLVAFDSNASGNFDVWVYRIAENDLFQVTGAPEDEELNDVFDDLIGYVREYQDDTSDVYVASISFDPCATKGGDTDGDGLCDGDDLCPQLAGAAQTDRDQDGVGDDCDGCPDDPANDVDGDGTCGDVDDCPTVSDPEQIDSDGDGLGDACDACPLDPTNDADGDGICGIPATGTCSDGGEPDVCGTCMQVTVKASRSYRPSRWAGDARCLCRPAALVIPPALEVTHGRAGQLWADLYFATPEGSLVRCRYRGDQHDQGRHGKAWPGDGRGDDYLFVKCEGTSRRLAPGDTVEATEIRIVVRSGDSNAGRTEVRATLSERGPTCGD